jgi:hypothetical protein
MRQEAVNNSDKGLLTAIKKEKLNLVFKFYLYLLFTMSILALTILLEL